MGATMNSVHWALSTDCETLRDPGDSRDNDVLVRQASSVPMFNYYVVLPAENLRTFSTIWNGGIKVTLHGSEPT